MNVFAQHISCLLVHTRLTLLLFLTTHGVNGVVANQRGVGVGCLGIDVVTVECCSGKINAIFFLYIKYRFDVGTVDTSHFFSVK
jgi:hypothetical protein